VDTVGFIRNLPHALVDAFHSTLEEAALADLLIHVADASDIDVDKFHATTLQVLESLGAADIPTITVLNKTDRLPGPPDETTAELRQRFPGAIPLSVYQGQGLEELKTRMEELLSGTSLRFRFPPDRGDLAGLLHRSAQVLSEVWDDEGILVEARVDGKLAGQLGQFRI
jgi:GTP-binding protein HflX